MLIVVREEWYENDDDGDDDKKIRTDFKCLGANCGGTLASVREVAETGELNIY
jgi:hypothetical protein